MKIIVNFADVISFVVFGLFALLYFICWISDKLSNKFGKHKKDSKD